MTQADHPVSASRGVLEERPLPLLPNEKFWKRYSPYHEARLGGVASLSIHLLAVVLLLLIGWYISKLQATEKHQKLFVVEVPGLPPIGGDRAPEPGAEPGDRSREPVEAVPARPVDRPVPELKSSPRANLAVPPAVAEPGRPLPNLPVDPTADRLAGAEGLRQSLEAMDAELTKKLIANLGEPNGAGRAGGGPGPGGVGTPGGEARKKRILRWSMVFSTANGRDYVRQLRGLGAILAVPDPKMRNEFLVIRDLTRVPARGVVEDVTKLNRIFWIDDKPASVAALATALGIKPNPERVVAFFPEELEQKLLKLEHDHEGRTEDEILETRFEVRLNRSGKYEPVVVSQTPR